MISCTQPRPSLPAPTKPSLIRTLSLIIALALYGYAPQAQAQTSSVPATPSTTSTSPTPHSVCGDTRCDSKAGETCKTCASDCGSCVSSDDQVISDLLKIKPEQVGLWVIEARITHDFDHDGHIDLALVATTKSEDPYNDERERVLAIGRGTKSGYQPALRTTCVTLCQACGGVIGDPFEGIRVRGKRSLVATNYGGSRERWGYTFTLAWRDGAFKVVGLDLLSHDTLVAKSKETLSINLLSGRYQFNHTPLRKHTLKTVRADDCKAVDELIKRGWTLQ